MPDIDPRDLRPERIRPIHADEYERMVSLGMFDDERVELLRGVIVEMSPHTVETCTAAERLGQRLAVALDGRARVRQQLSFRANPHFVAEPDIAVIPLDVSYDRHPDRAHFIVEIALSSLRKDRGMKASDYAAAGVPEYWIVNLVDRRFEVLRQPTETGYTDVRTYAPGETVTSLAFPDVALDVADILGG